MCHELVMGERLVMGGPMMALNARSMPYSLRVCILSRVATLFTCNSFVTLLIRGLTAQVLVEWKDVLFLIVSGGDEVAPLLEDFLYGLIAAGSFR